MAIDFDKITQAGSARNTPQPKKSTWSNIKTGGFKVLNKVTDVLQRGQYASAAAAREVVKNQKSGRYKPSKLDRAMNFVIPGFSAVKSFKEKNVRAAAIKGLKGEDKETYMNVLKETGMKEGPTLRTKYGNVNARDALGTALDVVADPTTWLTLGTGTGAKLAGKTGTKTLNRVGSKAFEEMTEQIGTAAAKKAMQEAAEKVTGKGFANLAESSLTKAGERHLNLLKVKYGQEPAQKKMLKMLEDPDLAAKFVDKGGIKFAGWTVPGTDLLTEPISKYVKSKVGAKFGRDKEIANNPLAQRTNQKYLDIENSQIRDYQQVYGDAFRGINARDRKLITEAIETGTVEKLDKRLQKAADFAMDEFEDIWQKENARGMITAKRSNYVTKLDKKGTVRSTDIGYANNVSAKNRFAKPRVSDLVDDMTERDIKKILEARRNYSIKQTNRYDLLDEIAKTQGTNARLWKTSKKVMDEGEFDEGSYKITKTNRYTVPNPDVDPTHIPIKGTNQLKGKVFPRDVAAYIERVAAKSMQPDEIHKVAAAYDGAMKFIKGSLTTLFPAFHFRNATSNVMQNWLDIGLAQSLNPKLHYIAADLAAAGGDTRMIKIANKEYSKGELRQFLKELGVLQGKGPSEFGGYINPYNVGALAGRGIENQARLVNFVANWEKYGDAITAAERTKKFLFDYDNLSPFEEKVMKRVFPFYCVPEYSEILTRDGWKFHDEIKRGTEVLTYNIEKRITEWQPVKDVAVFDFDGELKTLESRGTEFVFTEDHRWPVITKKTKTKGKWYGDESKIVRAYELNKNHLIPLAAEVSSDGSILSERDASLLGWLVTDGYFRWKGKSLEAMIYQSPKKHAQLVRDMFSDIISSESIHPDTGVICFRIRTSAFGDIKKHFASKDDLPSIVTRLGKKELHAMYEAMMLAEGHDGLKGKQFVQRIGGVMDAFQIICNLLGRSFNIKLHKTNGTGYGYVRSTTTLDIAGWKRKVKHYTGKIWCPKTQNSTWVMRQHGKVIITGNTWTSKNIALTMEQLVKNPGKYATQVKLFDKSSEEDKSTMPDYKQNSFNMKTPDGRYISGLGTPLEAFTETLGDPVGNAVFSLSPLLRGPAEAALGRDFTRSEDGVRGRPIETDTNARNTILAAEYLPKWIKELAGYQERPRTNFKGEKYTEKTANGVALWLLRQPPLSRISSTGARIEKEDKAGNVNKMENYIAAITGVRVDEVDVELQKYLASKEGIKQSAKPYIQRGLIADGDFGYYVPKGVDFSPEEKAEAKAVKNALNKMSDSIAYKKPDGEGYLSENLSNTDLRVLMLSNMMASAPEGEKKKFEDAMLYTALGLKKTPSWAKGKTGKVKKIKTYKVPKTTVRKAKSISTSMPKLKAPKAAPKLKIRG